MKYRLNEAMTVALTFLSEVGHLTNLKDVDEDRVYFVSDDFRSKNNLSKSRHLFPKGCPKPDPAISASTINALRKRSLVTSRSNQDLTVHTITLSEKGETALKQFQERGKR